VDKKTLLKLLLLLVPDADAEEKIALRVVYDMIDALSESDLKELFLETND